jgi:hypothetical protein
MNKQAFALLLGGLSACARILDIERLPVGIDTSSSASSASSSGAPGDAAVFDAPRFDAFADSIKLPKRIGQNFASANSVPIVLKVPPEAMPGDVLVAFWNASFRSATSTSGWSTVQTVRSGTTDANRELWVATRFFNTGDTSFEFAPMNTTSHDAVILAYRGAARAISATVERQPLSPNGTARIPELTLEVRARVLMGITANRPVPAFDPIAGFERIQIANLGIYESKGLSEPGVLPAQDIGVDPGAAIDLGNFASIAFGIEPR